MVDVRGFNFYFEGEDVNGNYLYGEVGVETTEFDEATKVVCKEAFKLLDENKGGHLDIYHTLQK